MFGIIILKLLIFKNTRDVDIIVFTIYILDYYLAVHLHRIVASSYFAFLFLSF